MKRKVFFSTLFAGILAGMIFSPGCKKNDTNPGNHFTYDDNTYSLSQGYITKANGTGDLKHYEMSLLSEGLNFVWEDNHYDVDSTVGKGDFILLVFSTASTDGLPDGTYTFKEWHQMTEKSCYGNFYLNFTWDEGPDFKSYKFDGGTLTVKNLGNNEYELTFNLTSGQKTFSGYFKGTFTLYNGLM